MDWGANPKPLKTTYTTLIQPIMEYATLIRSHVLNSALEKLDNIQASSAKIITVAKSKCKDKIIKLKHQICKLTTSRSLAKTQISDSPFEDLYTDNCLQIAEAVWTVHGLI